MGPTLPCCPCIATNRPSTYHSRVHPSAGWYGTSTEVFPCACCNREPRLDLAGFRRWLWIPITRLLAWNRVVLPHIFQRLRQRLTDDLRVNVTHILGVHELVMI